MNIFLILALIFSLPWAQECHAGLVIASIFKNECPWLNEWLAYHRAIGINKFILYDNESDDNPLSVLNPYIEKGIVNYVPWKTLKNEREAYSWVKKTQLPAFHDAIMRSQQDEWVAFIDTDEFIVLKQHINLKAALDEFLSANPLAGALGISWLCFGHSNVWDLADCQLLIENLNRHAAPNFEHHGIGKVIARPQLVKGFQNPHEALLHPPYCCLHFNGEDYSYENRTRNWNSIQINHYCIRTKKYFNTKKKVKKLEMDGFLQPQNWWSRFENDLNACEDQERAVLRFRDKTRYFMHSI